VSEWDLMGDVGGGGGLNGWDGWEGGMVVRYVAGSWGRGGGGL